MFTTLSEFYTSDLWRKFRKNLILERINKSDGLIYDEFSGKPILNTYDIVLHHIQPLTMRNVNDFTISLNPENIMIVTHKSHNEIHKRFGYCTQQKVYYVYGAPCSGKSTFVNDNRGNSDIVFDIDNIWECLTGGERYFKPPALNKNVFAVRDCVLDMIKTRYGKWERAWIIEGGARKADRERRIKSLGAEPIFIDTDKKTCLMRLANDEKRIKYVDEWTTYIEQYFNEYQE